MFFYYPALDILIFAALGLSIWAQFKVRGNFNEWMQVRASSGMSGAQAARIMLDRQGLYHIPVEPVPGTLSDHYDPMDRVVRLSEDVYYGQSIAALSVACHEVGHAIQHKVHYPMLVMRHRIFPIVNFASGAAPILFLIGFLLHWLNLIAVGIVFFSAAVAFQLITLPVEFNASSRANKLMVAEGFILPDEQRGVRKVLGAAALTYLAAALISVLELLKYVMIFLGQSNRDDD
jgi:uncharacterized protein